MQRTRAKSYNVSGFEIEVEPVYEGLEVRFTRWDTTYRIKIAPDSDTPCAGRYHPSMALAEPVIPHNVYSAMLDAVAQHGHRRY